MSNLLHDQIKLQTIKFCGSNNSEQLLTIDQNATIGELTTKILASDEGWSTMIAKSNVELMIQLKVRYHDNIGPQLKSNDLVKNKIGSKDIVFIHLKSPNQSSKGISMSITYNCPKLICFMFIAFSNLNNIFLLIYEQILYIVPYSMFKDEKQQQHVQSRAQSQTQFPQTNCTMNSTSNRHSNIDMGCGVRDNRRSVYMQRANGAYPFVPVDQQQQRQLQLEQDADINVEQLKQSKYTNGMTISQLEWDIIKVFKLYNQGIFEQDFPFCFLNANQYGLHPFQFSFSSFRQLFDCYENILFNIDKYSRKYIDGQWILYPTTMIINKYNINFHYQRVAPYACGNSIDCSVNNNTHQKGSVTGVGYGVDNYHSYNDERLQKLGLDIVKVLKKHKNGVIEKDFSSYFFNVNGYYIKNISSLFISFRQLVESLKSLYNQFDIDKTSRADSDGQWILRQKFTNDSIGIIINKIDTHGDVKEDDRYLQRYKNSNINGGAVNKDDTENEEQKQSNVQLQVATASHSDSDQLQKQPTTQQTITTKKRDVNNDSKKTVLQHQEKEESKTKKKTKDLYFDNNLNIIKEIQYIHKLLYANSNNQNCMKQSKYCVPPKYHGCALNEKYTKNEYTFCKSLLYENKLWNCDNSRRARINKVQCGWRISATNRTYVESNFALRGVLGKYYFEIKINHKPLDCKVIEFGFYGCGKRASSSKPHICYDFLKSTNLVSCSDKYITVKTRFLSTGDTVRVVIDYNQREIEFLRNDRDFIMSFRNILCDQKYLGPYFRTGDSTITVIFDQKFFQYPMPEGCEPYFINTTVMIYILSIFCM